VRARDTVSGLSEHNTDARVTVTVGPDGSDASDRPYAPEHARAFPGPGGTAVVEWADPHLDPARLPAGFHVYLGRGSVAWYAPAARVPFQGGPRLAFFRCVLVGLLDGVTYKVGVRAFNASGEECNARSVSVVGRATGPAAVASLSGSAGH
jgi:hypothetical protein